MYLIIFAYRNGDTYAGEYFEDKMHGYGVYSFANGHRYEGSWHEGRKQGLGTYTFRNGEMQSGHWHNGILNIPSSHSATHPVSPVAVYHSRVLHAVQVTTLIDPLMTKRIENEACVTYALQLIKANYCLIVSGSTKSSRESI